MRNITMVIGCGRLGATIANYSSQAGDNVVVLDPDKHSFEQLNDSFSGYTIACDASDSEELVDAGIDDAKELIITTGDDNLNLFLAQIAESIYKVPYIYVRFDDPTYALLIQGMHIKAIYPFQLCVDRFNQIRSSGGDKE